MPSNTVTQLASQCFELVWCFNIACKKDKSPRVGIAKKGLLARSDLQPVAPENICTLPHVRQVLALQCRNTARIARSQCCAEPVGVCGIFESMGPQAIKRSAARLRFFNDTGFSLHKRIKLGTDTHPFLTRDAFALIRTKLHQTRANRHCYRVRCRFLSVQGRKNIACDTVQLRIRR